MRPIYLYLGLTIALAVVNLVLLAIRTHRCCAGKEATPKIKNIVKQFFTTKPSEVSFVVVRHKSVNLDANATYTAMDGAHVVAEGARGVAMAASQIVALDRAETLALEGTSVLGEFGSTTHAYTGANVRVKRGGIVHLTRGVKAYARNGCDVVNYGGSIYNYGDPCVIEGLEPARVVGESGAVIIACKGSEVITEPGVSVKHIA